MVPIRCDALFIKICGLKSAGEARFAVDAGADAIGINFYAKSKRHVPLHSAEEWLDDFRGAVCRVALFVNAPLDEISEAVDTGLFEMVQLHGDEPPDFCGQVRRLGLPVMRAVAITQRDQIPALTRWPADILLIDAPAPHAYGGTGMPADWALAAEVVSSLSSTERKIVLSGGLNPDNVATAIQQVKPAGIDVATGVEDRTGRKDRGLIARFVERARTAFSGTTRT